MDTEGGKGLGSSQSQSRHKNIYLTDSDEAIVDLVKDHEELFDKTNGNFKDKASKECLWERLTSSCKLSVKVCKAWFESQITCCRKLPRK